MRAVTESRTGIHDKARLPGGIKVSKNAKRKKNKIQRKAFVTQQLVQFIV